MQSCTIKSRYRRALFDGLHQASLNQEIQNIGRQTLYPSENKILIRYKDMAQNGWFNVIDFWFIGAESLEFVELGLKLLSSVHEVQ
jgi:hypothetical protein